MDAMQEQLLWQNAPTASSIDISTIEHKEGLVQEDKTYGGSLDKTYEGSDAQHLTRTEHVSTIHGKEQEKCGYSSEDSSEDSDASENQDDNAHKNRNVRINKQVFKQKKKLEAASEDISILKEALKTSTEDTFNEIDSLKDIIKKSDQEATTRELNMTAKFDQVEQQLQQLMELMKQNMSKQIKSNHTYEGDSIDTSSTSSKVEIDVHDPFSEKPFQQRKFEHDGKSYITKQVQWKVGDEAYYNMAIDDNYFLPEPIIIDGIYSGLTKAEPKKYRVTDKSDEPFTLEHHEIYDCKDEQAEKSSSTSNDKTNLMKPHLFKTDKFDKSLEKITLASDSISDIKRLYEKLCKAARQAHSMNIQVLPSFDSLQQSITIRELMTPKTISQYYEDAVQSYFVKKLFFN